MKLADRASARVRSCPTVWALAQKTLSPKSLARLTAAHPPRQGLNLFNAEHSFKGNLTTAFKLWKAHELTISSQRSVQLNPLPQHHQRPVHVSSRSRGCSHARLEPVKRMPAGSEVAETPQRRHRYLGGTALLHKRQRRRLSQRPAPSVIPPYAQPRRRQVERALLWRANKVRCPRRTPPPLRCKPCACTYPFHHPSSPGH